MGRRLEQCQPGEKGYAAYWKQELRKVAPQISALRNGVVSGRTILGVLNVYGSQMNNNSGQCFLSQQALGQISGVSVRSVSAAQKWAAENGWLEVLAGASPGRKGQTVVLTVGSTPAGSAGDRPAIEDVQHLQLEEFRPASRGLTSAGTCGETLSKDSHLELSGVVPPEEKIAKVFAVAREEMAMRKRLADVGLIVSSADPTKLAARPGSRQGWFPCFDDPPQVTTAWTIKYSGHRLDGMSLLPKVA